MLFLTYTVYPQVESLIDRSAQLPCNISHPNDDTLLMILVYYNPHSNTAANYTNKPIGLTSGGPVFTLDLRDKLHSQYINRYLHKNKFQGKIKHNKRSLPIDQQLEEPIDSPIISSLDLLPLNLSLELSLDSSNQPDLLPSSLKSKLPHNQTYVPNDLSRMMINKFNNQMLNNLNSTQSTSFLRRKLRDIDDKKANELLINAQFISPSYADRFSFNFSSNREQFLLNIAKLKERDGRAKVLYFLFFLFYLNCDFLSFFSLLNFSQIAGEFVCRADFKWSRTLISVVNLFVIGKLRNISSNLLT